jgi:hypothetical protein
MNEQRISEAGPNRQIWSPRGRAKPAQKKPGASSRRGIEGLEDQWHCAVFFD